MRVGLPGGRTASGTRAWRAARGGFWLLALLLVPAGSGAESSLPVLRANSGSVDIQDGDRRLKGVWNVDPTVPLDVYNALRTARPKRVTFVTDIDSLSIETRPGQTYDFIIRLADRDDCRTRVSTLTQGYRRIDTSAAGPDTIPITISGGKLHLRGSINGSADLDLLFDTGADMCALYPSALRRGVQVKFDGHVVNVGTGGATTRRTSGDNRVEVAGLRWEHEPFIVMERQADPADGIVGYPLFQDRVVEFDYDRMILIVHDTLPERAAAFARVPMTFVGSLTAVDVTLVNNGSPASGPFILDTAGSGALNLNPAMAAAHGLPGTLRSLGASRSRGVGRATIRNQRVLLPELRLAGYSLADVPIDIQLPTVGDTRPPGGTLNMEILSRFNAFFDYPRGEACFRPNGHFNTRFRRRAAGPPRLILIGLAALAVASLALVLAMARGRRARSPAATQFR